MPFLAGIVQCSLAFDAYRSALGIEKVNAECAGSMIDWLPASVKRAPPAAIDGVQQAEQDGVAKVVWAGGHKQAGPRRQDAGKAQQEYGNGDGHKADRATDVQLPAGESSIACCHMNWQTGQTACHTFQDHTV